VILVAMTTKNIFCGHDIIHASVIAYTIESRRTPAPKTERKKRDDGTNGNDGTDGNKTELCLKLSVSSVISVCSVISLLQLLMETTNHRVGIIAAPRESAAVLSNVEMSTSVIEQLVVDSSGEYWDVEDVRLFRSTDPHVLLFAPTRLALERSGRNARYQAALTQFRRLHEGVWHYAGGSALLIVTSAVQPTADYQQHFAERWRSALFEQGYDGQLDPVFLPLPRRKQRVQVLLDSDSGTSHHLGEEENYSDTAAIVIELTGKGAQEWGRCVREKTPLRGMIRWIYEYPVMLPEAEASFTVDGLRTTTHPQFEPGDLSLKLIFRARTWQRAKIETDFSALLHPLDESYLNVVPVENGGGFPIIIRTRAHNGGAIE
jgi:hypothetical protein